MWSSYEDCKNIVQDKWVKYGRRDCETPVQQFQRVAKSSLAQLKIWSKSEFEDRKQKLDEMIKQLKNVK